MSKYNFKLTRKDTGEVYYFVEYVHLQITYSNLQKAKVEIEIENII